MRGLVPSGSLRGKRKGRHLRQAQDSHFCYPPPSREPEAEGLRFLWRHSPIPGEATVWAPKMAASEGMAYLLCRRRSWVGGWGLGGVEGRELEGDGSFLSSLGNLAQRTENVL